MSSYDTAGSWSLYPPEQAGHQSGQPTASHMAQPPGTPASAGEPPHSSAVLPKVIGIISIIFGALGIIMHAFQTVMLMFIWGPVREMQQEFGLRPSGVSASRQDVLSGLGISQGLMVIASALLVMWSMLLVFAGVRLLKQRSSGVVMHVIWAVGKLILSVMVVVPAILLLSQMSSLMHSLSGDVAARGSRVGPPQFSMTLPLLQFIGALAMAWSYPLFILVWLSIRKLK